MLLRVVDLGRSTGVRGGVVARGPAHDAERGWIPYRTVTSRTTPRRSPCSAAIKRVGAAPHRRWPPRGAKELPVKAEWRSVAPRPADEAESGGDEPERWRPCAKARLSTAPRGPKRDPTRVTLAAVLRSPHDPHRGSRETGVRCDPSAATKGCAKSPQRAGVSNGRENLTHTCYMYSCFHTLRHESGTARRTRRAGPRPNQPRPAGRCAILCFCRTRDNYCRQLPAPEPVCFKSPLAGEGGIIHA